jgi:PAS domain S-box-containing protein
MANSGAETAVLLMKLDNDWFVQARGNVSSQDHEVLLNLPLESGDINGTESVPERVHQYCRRSMEVLIVGDARSDDRFAEDKTVQTRNIRSMTCIPILAKGECRSMLYLENCHVEDAFTEERIDLLKHLSSQFGISVENALLYANLNKKIEEIEESESRFRSVVENAKETIIVTQDDVVKYCNEQIRELAGYSPAEISSKSFDAFIHPEDLDQVRREYQSRISGKRSTNSYSIRIITKNGQEKHAFVNAALVNWDGRPASLALLADITEQKQAEEALLKSEKRFRSLIEQSPLAIELLEPNGQISQVNKAWRKLWGLKSEEVARVVSKYNIRTDPQFEDQGAAHLVEKAFSGQNIVIPPFKYDVNRTLDDFEIEGIKGVKQPWIQCHLYSVKNANGEIAHVVNTYLDISDLKYAEHESQKKMEMLALVGRASRMGQLTGSIAHELNQPLTGILSNAQAAELMMNQNLWEKEGLRDIIGDIISDTKRAVEVIRNLKELYREQKIEFLPIDINSVIDESIRLLHSEIIMHQVALTTDLESSLPPVNGNRVQLQQVLVNLIMNGLHAMSGKENENRQLHIISAFNKNKINVWVEDNGTGIEPEKIDRIFEPLVTLEPGGTGMGLAISSSIIESHGGKMSAENRDGGGARIGFFFPSLTRKKQK